MAIKENNRLVIFNGCSHNDLMNIVDTVTMELDGVPNKAVIGGFHLVSSPPFHLRAVSKDKVEEVSKAVVNYPIDMTYTGYCKGIIVNDILKSVMGHRITYIKTGSCFEV